MMTLQTSDFTPTLTTLSLGLAAIWAASIFATVVYRLFLDPLSKFPGPKLAAATSLYEGYYDVIKRGKYIHKIEELHQRYGPIIRINPHELHIYDSNFYDHVYNGKGKWEKSPEYTRSIDSGTSVFGTVDHDLHRLRRASLNPFFSKQKVTALQSVIQDLSGKLCTKLEACKGTDTAIDLESALGDFSMDVISEYCFDTKMGRVDRPGFSSDFRSIFRGLTELGHMAKLTPLVMMLFDSLPDNVVLFLNPRIKMLQEYDASCLALAKRLLRAESEGSWEDKGHPTVFREIIASADLPPSEKTPERLQAEAKVIINAGTVTTSWALTSALWHLTDNPDQLAKLRAEIRTVMSDPRHKPARLQQLEQLPYLTAVLNEALRISTGVTARSARIAPDRILMYDNWEIPRGTAVTLTAAHVHFDPAIFPNPKVFNPERWVGEAEARQRLERYLVVFSKGTRGCLGINLAWAELRIMLSNLVMRMDLVPFETTKDNIELYSDMVVPEPKNYQEPAQFLIR
ncbi:Uu.00g032980.m01.CDS01 [Anthostomella pinea]|uniref:Uu.00g032980.m01.CDS01 n=1 Tax=Anthostomella pinea TaxID=933095 RepID=A0AAI8YD72_9PEZI|nr:Uu.00g032980.m01.CDS01 [Anthostomella pinea]